MTLSELAVGAKVRVIEINGSDAIASRLLEMGLTPGVEVRFCGTALWGDPMELEVRGYRLSIRKSEAARIMVQPV